MNYLCPNPIAETADNLPLATLYSEGMFGYTVTHVRDLKVEVVKYAQYDKAVRVTLIMDDALNSDNLMAGLDAAVFARAGKPISKTERDPIEVEPQREIEAAYFKAQWHEQRAQKGGAL